MIAHIKGVLTETDLNSVIIDVNGLGYQVHVPLSTSDRLPRPGAEIALRTHMIMREDDVSRYGFHTDEERKLFRLLLNVSGVGAKIALAALSCLPPATFCQAVTDNNVKVISSISGIGKKTAERLLIELRDKVKDLCDDKDALLQEAIPYENAIQDEAESALVALGYKPQDAAKAIKQAKHENQSLESLIKAALKSMI